MVNRATRRRRVFSAAQKTLAFCYRWPSADSLKTLDRMAESHPMPVVRWQAEEMAGSMWSWLNA